MDKLTGNRGEWSEFYAFLRILADGRIYAADGNINKRNDVFYDVLKVIRNGRDNALEFVISDDEEHVSVMKDGVEILSVKRSRFTDESKRLLNRITTSKGSFSAEDTQKFMSEIKCYSIKSPSNNKQDIRIQIHDARTGMEPLLGFSIKSMLGHPSTLLNAGKTTNFVYKVTEKDTGKYDGVHYIDIPPKGDRKLSDWYKDILSYGMKFEFVRPENDIFEGNLSLIDTMLDKIVAEMLKLYYIEGINSISEQAQILQKQNPLGLKLRNGVPLYEYKIKKLLAAVALGMKPATPWNGKEDATGGYIIVKNDGEVLCYHIYNRDDFEEYLFRNTKLDTPSTTRYGFSEIYKVEDAGTMVKLNLQIRFK